MRFCDKYPHVYSEFKNLIDQRESSKEFIANLDQIYDAIENNDKDAFNNYWSKLYNNKIVHKHPFFGLLLSCLPIPNIILIPPYLDALENALSNTNINYQNKANKMKALLVKNSFRGTCIELILANILEKKGYQVTILDDSNQMHPDLEIRSNNIIFNIEVSQREYKVNPKHSTKTLIKKLIEEGKQLLGSKGYNIVVLFFDNVLNFGKQISPDEIYTCFRVLDSLYFNKNGQEYFILDIHKNLSHISAVGFLLNGQVPLNDLGKKTGMFLFKAKKNSPIEVLTLLKSIKYSVEQIFFLPFYGRKRPLTSCVRRK